MYYGIPWARKHDDVAILKIVGISRWILEMQVWILTATTLKLLNYKNKYL